jgi:hypothetical protein
MRVGQRQTRGEGNAGMKRRDLLIGGVIAAVTGLSWSVSLVRDDAEISARSYAAGREWAQQRTSARPVDCELEVLGITGPDLDSAAWRRGCRSQAIAQTPPHPSASSTPPPGTPSAAPPPPEPPPGLPRPR